VFKLSQENEYFSIAEEEEQFQATEEGMKYAKRAEYFLRCGTYLCCVWGFIGIIYYIKAKNAKVDRITLTSLKVSLAFSILSILITVGVVVGLVIYNMTVGF